MRPLALFSIFSLSLILLSGCFSTGNSVVSNQTANTIGVQLMLVSLNLTIFAEKADTPQKMERGLMGRTTLGEKQGMLFIFNESGYHMFWMANTPLPLEILFLDENLTIVDIIEMNPCVKMTLQTCPTYRPKNPATYALELNQNFSKKYNVSQGMKFALR